MVGKSNGGLTMTRLSFIQKRLMAEKGVVAAWAFSITSAHSHRLHMKRELCGRLKGFVFALYVWCVCVCVQWETQYYVIAVWTWHPCCCSTGWDSPSLIKYWRSENSLSNQISQGIPLIPLNSRFPYSPQEVFYTSTIKEEDCSLWGSDEAMKKRGSS